VKSKTTPPFAMVRWFEAFRLSADLDQAMGLCRDLAFRLNGGGVGWQ
jgi:hypothetical protein